MVGHWNSCSSWRRRKCLFHWASRPGLVLRILRNIWPLCHHKLFLPQLSTRDRKWLWCIDVNDAWWCLSRSKEDVLRGNTPQLAYSKTWVLDAIVLENYAVLHSYRLHPGPISRLYVLLQAECARLFAILVYFAANVRCNNDDCHRYHLLKVHEGMGDS